MDGDGASPDASLEAWRRAVEAALKGASWETLRSRTLEGLPIEPVYPRRADAAPLVGTRRAGRWRVAQRMDHPDPEAAARLALLDLENGADALTLVAAGGRMARGYGLALHDMDSLGLALDGTDLNAIRVRVERGHMAAQDAACLARYVEHRNLSPDVLELTFGLDPVGTAAERGAFEDGPETDGRRAARTARDLSLRGFGGPFLLVDGRPWHEAGAGEAQELAAMLATAVAYLRLLESGGLTIGVARAALHWLLPMDSDELMGIAKLRALRRLVAALDQGCGLPATALRIEAETSWRMLTRADPHTNLLRCTIAAFTAALGGADQITVLPFTSALGLPDAFARRLARNTQAILLEEANLWRVADPLAGSGAVETLTDALAEEAWSGFQQIEREGGIGRSLEAGALQARMAVTREARRAAIASGARAIIGVTLYPPPAPVSVATLPAEPRFEQGGLPTPAAPIEPLAFVRDEELAALHPDPRCLAVSSPGMTEATP